MKYIIFCCFQSFLFVSLIAQNYNPFPDSNAVWNIAYSQGNRSYKVFGDSIFNSITYKRYFYASTTSSNPAQYAFFGLMREDVLNKKVHFIKSGMNQERLLYDFSLGINDTVSVFAQDFGFPNTVYKLKVIGIDSIPVNGQYRRRMLMKANSMGLLQEHWIEGVGSSYGVFTPGLSDFFIVDAEVCIELRCFWQNSSLVYSTYSPPLCYTSKTNCFVGLNEWKSRERIIQCFPNPFTDEVTLYSNQEETGSLQIKDLLGNTLYSTLMTNSNQNSISLGYLASGFYFIVFRNNDGRILLQEKFLKSE